MSLFLAMTIMGLLATGMGVALLGSVKLPLARKLQINETRVGGAVSMFGFAMIPTMLAVGFVTDLIGKQPVVIAGALCMTASLIVLAGSRSYGLALLGVLLLSVGWATLINVINPLALIAFPSSATYAMNMANFIFGVGAFLTPLAVAFLLRRTDLAKTLVMLAAVALATAVLAAVLDFSSLAATGPRVDVVAAPPQGIGVLLRDPVMWLCGLLLFFYAPMDATMAAWATTYLGGKGISEGRASGLLSAYWLTYVAARLAAAFLVPVGGEATVVLVLSLLAVAIWLTAVFSRGQVTAAVTLIAAGFVFGPIYPNFMAILLGHFDKALHGRAIGLLFVLGGLGWTVIPMLIGAYAQRKGVQRGFLMAAGCAAGLVVVSLILVL